MAQPDGKPVTPDGQEQHERAQQEEALFALLLAEEGLSPAQPESIPRRARIDDPPLSFAQQRLWFLHQLEAGSDAYTIPLVLQLAGSLDVAALQHSLAAIAHRHETLRTTLPMRDGGPVQVVQPRGAAPELPLRDLRHLPVGERTAAAHRLLREHIQQPFDLAHGPLWRVVLLRTGDAEHILLIALHHTIADGGSLAILLHELGVHYTAAVDTAQPAPPLPDLPIHYGDFAAWQRNVLQGAALEQPLAYWRQQLAGAPPLLALPTDYPRPPVQSMRGATLHRTLPRPLTDALKELCQREDVTLFMLLSAGLAVLLARYSGQTDISIGSPVANRSHEELEHLIGLFVNTLVFRADLSGNPTFCEVLGRVREMALEGYAHQEVPFDRVVEALQPERDLSYQPLFQVMLVFDQPLPLPTLPGLTLTHLEVESGTALFDLSLWYVERHEGLAGTWEYATDLFTAATIERMAGHFEQLLTAAVATPDAPIATLPLLTPAERQQMLVEWNATHMAYPHHQCIHHLVTAQATRTPDAVAVVCGDEQLTYRQLEQRSNVAARRVQAFGIAPDVLVGIYVERSVDMLVGLLAILKAGGAYVPLDPTYPRERLAFMIADSQLALLVTQRRLLDALPPHSVPLLCIDNADDRAGGDVAPPASSTTPEHLAYVIYTSGSTGKPKGVQIPHRAVVNFLCGMQQQPGLSADDTLLSVTTLSFDIAVLELFLPLIVGARLLIVSRETAADGVLLADALAASTTTVMQATPATWRLLLAAGWQGVPHLTMLCGGEALPWELAHQLLPRGKALWNMYGPTETTIWSSCLLVRPEDGEAFIGAPMANTQFYVLDAAQQPLPVGVPGELSIGGDGLARGYLNRPQLTAEKFVTVAPGDQPPARLYRTGDLVRFLPDGRLAFLGRIDNQVKLRGFRIELGEIETLLRQHEAVQEAVVVAREERPGDQRLVAYVLPHPQQQPAPETLRRMLQAHVPDYMVPSAFVLLDALPLTPNGKIDRRALPAPHATTAQPHQRYAPPRTPLETQLSSIWAQVLGVEHTGIHDDFFALGGHSLQAMHLVAQVTKATGLPLAIRDIFLYPTVALLAPVLEQRTASAPAAPAPAMPDAPDTPDTPDAPGTPYLQLEPRPLLALFATGRLPPVDAASLYYLPPGDLPLAFLEQNSLSRAQVIHDWYDGVPVYDELIESDLGRIATIVLPRFGDELYQEHEHLVALIIEALELAAHLGARVVSLTGTIPSATDYGHAVAAALAQRGSNDLPRISTGHATTTSAVVLALRRIAAESKRDMAHEHVGFLGLGSIGVASLRLMLHCLPHPQHITLCDLYSKRADLEHIKHEISTVHGFRGTITLLESRGAVPDGFYAATTIVGATNVPDILESERIRPGTLIVDDSFPHCFDSERLLQRFATHHDVLVTEGGVLQAPHALRSVRSLPRRISAALSPPYRQAYMRHNPYTITGCIFSSLLSAHALNLPPTLGYVDVETSLQHYTALCDLGFAGAPLHCAGVALEAPLIRAFRQRFGGGQAAH